MLPPSISGTLEDSMRAGRCDRGTGFTRRREHEHATDADDVDVFDVVPCGKLAVIEPVVECDLVKGLAALDGMGRRRSFRRRRRCRGGWRTLDRFRRRRGALADRRRRTGHARYEQQRRSNGRKHAA
jgi:hypothetical protein